MGDFVIGFTANLVGQIFGSLPFVSVRADGTTHVHVVPATIGAIVGGTAATVLALWVVSRWKGRASLRRDYGAALRGGDVAWLLVGLGFSLVVGLVLLPLTRLHGGPSQEVVKQFEKASGGGAIAYAAAVVLLAPLGEELLYRGLLLRALLRRVTPAWALWTSAFAFGLVHVAFDPGSYLVLPGLVALGVLSGWRATRTGELSQSFYLHAGFNLLTAISILAR